ncbi:MAG TPA: hypothetical protein GXX70_09385 [Tepidimicrobium sp.]|jgi:hypothetical protein|nr:hypothetical protein [Tepidimicrobium sp.]
MVKITDYPNFTIDVEDVIYNGPATIVFYRGVDGNRRKAVAKCHPDDFYSEELGRVVAVLKAVQKEIPKLIKQLTS